MLTKFLKGNEQNIDKANYKWNLIAGGVNAAESIVMMMVISRVINTEASGILSIAFAVGNLLMNIGKYGVRSYQVTDVEDKYSFNVYYSLRIFTVAAMLLATLIYSGVKLFSGSYDISKTVVVFSICLIYCIEAYEDVYLGKFQREGRLDTASKIFVVRWIMTMIVFIIAALITKDLAVATVMALVTTMVMELILLNIAKAIFNEKKPVVGTEGVKSLMKQCFALFAATFATYYVTNAPKYAIDEYLDGETLGYFGYISMPVFIIELLNNFLYQPQLVALSEEWTSGDVAAMNKRIRRQYLLIALISVVCIVGAYFVGTWGLTLLYGDDVTPYRSELCVIMCAGGMLAYAGYTSVILTIMRKQNFLLYGMALISLLALVGFGYAVKKASMMGASVYYLILITILVIYNLICIAVFRKNAGKKQDSKIQKAGE